MIKKDDLKCCGNCLNYKLLTWCKYKSKFIPKGNMICDQWQFDQSVHSYRKWYAEKELDVYKYGGEDK